MAKGLGRGLDALMNTKDLDIDVNIKAPEFVAGIEMIDINKIRANENQARKTFTKEEIDELADSIEQFGIIQPVLLKKVNGGYLLIAGERRFRAAKQVGLLTIPGIIKDLSDVELFEISLIENLQRVNLNPMEEANGIKYLMENFDLTQEEVSKRIGKNRSSVANVLRLTLLPKEIQKHIYDNKISFGHAKCLASLDDKDFQIYLANEIIDKGLSVRKVEEIIKKGAKAERQETKKELDLDLLKFQENLKDYFGTKVLINGSQNKGNIKIDYYSFEDLERIYSLLKK